MFVITEADAAAIRAVFNEEGELWTPLPAQLRPVTELRPRKDT